MSDAFDPYHKWLGIPSEEQPPNHYRLLAIRELESDEDVIANAADQRMAHVRTFQSGKHAEDSQRLLNAIAKARTCLLDAAKKRAYDAKLGGKSQERQTSGKPKTARPVSESPVEIRTRSASTRPVQRKTMRNQLPLIGALGAALVVVVVVGVLLLSGGGEDPETVTANDTDGTSTPERPAPSDPEKKGGTSNPPEDPGPQVPTPTPTEDTTENNDDKNNVSEPTQPVPETKIPDPPPVTPPNDGNDDPPKEPETPVTETAEPVVTKEVDQRAPIPSATSLAAADTLIQELFADDLEQAKTFPAQLELANKLMVQANEATDEPAEKHVLLSHAKQLAITAGDAETALQAVDQIAAAFQVEEFAIRVATLAAVRETAKFSTQNKTLAELSLTTLDESVARDDYAAAARLVDVARSSATKARNGPLFKLVKDRAEEVTAIIEEHKQVAPSAAVLDDSPDDPQANLAVGRFRCLIKGDWKAGLPLIAKGTEGELAKLAQRDLDGNDLTQEEATLIADGWFALFEQETGLAKQNAGRRAALWYGRVLPSLTGLAKANMEKRMRELPAAANPSGPASSSPTSPVVRRGLEWLARQQQADGSWSFRTGPDAGELDAPGAATSMALLAFVRSGQTHRAGDFKPTVEQGLAYLGRRMKLTRNGGSYMETGATMYGHALATMALCESYLRTKDRRLKEPAQRAVNFIVYAQDPVGGGWRYQPRQPGDTSVVGWQITALSIAQQAGLQVPAQTFTQANQFLDGVQKADGMNYGYTVPGSGRNTTAIGLYIRRLTGHPGGGGFDAGVASTRAVGADSTSIYFNYYATHLYRELGGERWQQWREQLAESLTGRQDQQGDVAGSWFSADHGHVASRAGRVGITALCLIVLGTLETEPKLPSTATPKQPERKTSPIPKDAATFRRHRYKVLLEQLSWREAKARCEAMGGHLAIVTSKDENTFLTQLAIKTIGQPQRMDGVWLGATDEVKEGEWVWVDGTKMTSGNWFTNQPNNKKQQEHYLLLFLQQSAWVDQPNASKQHRTFFACEWDAE